MANIQSRKVVLLRTLEDEGLNQKPARDQQGGSGTRGMKGVVKVPSLLFDIDLEDTVHEELADEEVEDVIDQLRVMLKPKLSLEKQLSEQVQRIQQDAFGDNPKVEALHLARKLCLPGYVFKMRTALGGSCAGSCLRQLRHYFMTCSSTDTPQVVSCVIDPLFREQFEIANPTKRYSKILAELPAVVVLSEERLLSLVTLLSHEMQQSFQATETTLPPWRHSSSMMSKWRPRRSEDTLLHPTSPCKLIMHKRPTETRAGRLIIPKLDAFASKDDKSHRDSSDSEFQRRPAIRTGFAARSPTASATSMGKRSREFGVQSAAYSSLLASKLRGVTSFDCGDRLPARGQA